MLDRLVHRPDLPLHDDTMKAGLGIWNCPAIAIACSSGDKVAEKAYETIYRCRRQP